MMVGFELADGREIDKTIDKMLNNPRAAYVHLHYAAPCCYAARVDRV